MSDKFNGFSPEDISKITSNTAKTMKSATIRNHGIRRMPDKKDLARSQENLKIKKPDRKINIKGQMPTQPPTLQQQEESIMDEINLNKSMSKSIEGALFYQPIPNTLQQNQNEQLDVSSSSDSPVENNSLNNSSILPEPSENIESSPFKGISLKDFEVHRKIIEEQNKQKKDLLHKAIEAHSQKTAAEAKKIEEIKIELSKLDNELATDVALLRKQIDSACIQYANIEKQYNKVEAQFLKAKIELHNASEKKELLTEHLCTVIAHNEDRKAQKLSELMHKVGLTPSGELAETSNGFHNTDSPSI
ncbi:RAB6-interacting golgin [Episyrphus balteatus]|uniref:RAB6-interacting golgin n=1 Tax=Episyrphus balteatus TaxID=286459 RepID=UPI002485012B|nr:RAB6-interacting golgin [Episyrphus balteatus]